MKHKTLKKDKVSTIKNTSTIMPSYCFFLVRLIFISLFIITLASAKDPNIVIIMTDEHNYRTLGCYRDQLSTNQAFIWGEGVKVDTPNIDSLAHEGALFTHFFASSPMCTPSRASFLSGLYPPATGAAENHAPMNSDTLTFAHILKENGWETGYVGKWHLNGSPSPGWSSEGKSVFGFNSTKYL